MSAVKFCETISFGPQTQIDVTFHAPDFSFCGTPNISAP